MTQQHHDPTARKLHGWEVRIQQGLDWVSEHPREVLATLGGALLLGLLVAAVYEWRDRREDAGQMALARVERAFAAAMGVDPATLPIPEPANAEQARKARREALEALNGVISDHARTRAADFASLRAAEFELDLGRPDDALERLGALADTLSESEPLRGVALRLAGYIHETRGESRAAADRYTQAAAVETYPDRAWLWMAAGDDYERAGEVELAIDSFSTGLNLDPVLGEQLRVVERIAALESRAAAAAIPAPESAEPALAPETEPEPPVGAGDAGAGADEPPGAP